MKIITIGLEYYKRICEIWEKSGLPYKPSGRDSYSAIKARLEETPTWILGAFIREKLVGVVIATHDGQRGWINRLAIDPKYRRKGIAKNLIQEAEDLLRIKKIGLWAALIEEDNIASRNLFESQGYIESKDLIYYSKRISKDY